MLTDRARDLIEFLERLEQQAAPADLRPPPSRWLAEAELEELTAWFEALAAAPPTNASAAENLMRFLYEARMQWRPETLPRQMAKDKVPGTSPALRAALAALYRALAPMGANRGQLLDILTAARSEADLRVFADLMADDPPAAPVATALAFWPLFHARDYDPAWVYPRLLDALAQPSAAAAVLDLANHLARTGRASPHPAAERKEQLFALLGGLAGRLGEFESRPVAAGESPEKLRDTVNESVALAVALCDAVALIGDRAAIPKLRQLLPLGHRRLRAEAAAALARLGEEEGREELIALAAEPAARLRVLHYAEELGILDRIAEEFRSPVARAEAELVAYLAAPQQLGLPPHEMELVDTRSLYWPGDSEPVTAFLFRYRYRFPEGLLEGTGLAGPLTHAFHGDLLASFSLDDQYAAFIGYSAEHEEIQELDASQLSREGQTEVARLVRRGKDAGYDAIEPWLLGLFFGEKLLVARAKKNGVGGTLIIDPEEEIWFAENGPRPLGPHEAYSLVKGRKLLRAFNK